MKRSVMRALVMSLLCAASMAALTSRPVAAADAKEKADEKAVIQVDHSLTEALGKADKTAVGALLDDNFEWTNVDGKTRTKAEALQNLTAFAKDNEEETSVMTHSYGQVGRVAGTRANTHFVRLWVKRPAGWRAFIYLEAPAPASPPRPAKPKPGDDVCENPCKTLPYTPTTVAQKAAIDTWQGTKLGEWKALPDEWKNYVSESMVVISPSQFLDKAGRLALLIKQKEAYGTGSPSPAVVSMKMYDFGNAVIMTSHHAPNAAGIPAYAVRMFVNEDGTWRIALSAQTDIKQPASASN
jgi:hypothetical protein